MKKKLIYLGLAVLSLTSCRKTIEGLASNLVSVEHAPAATNDFVKYTIKQGEQYCDRNDYTPVTYQELSFTVKFDSSAIYQTVNPNNQNDINKLFGFSDNKQQHHQFSARFGWRWSNNALRLFGYIYNNSVMSCKEIGTVAIGSENNCSIKVSGNTYLFTLNGQTMTMPRAATTPAAEGYKLFPYFGGDELAPHDVSIWIKENVVK